MNDLRNRLTSRTFWVAVGTIILLVANHQYTEAASVAVSYILGEKAVDTFSNRPVIVSTPKNPMSQNDDEEVDTSVIVSGKTKDVPVGTPMFDEQPKK